MKTKALRQTKSDIIHYRNLLKIMDYDGYGEWDMGKQEMCRLLWLYRSFIINEVSLTEHAIHASGWKKLCDILEYDE